jgi:Fe-S oxidoreductase
MKIEVQAARTARHGLALRDRLVGYLPRYAPVAARIGWLLNLRNRSPVLARLMENFVGLSARRALPRWRRDVFAPADASVGPTDGPEVVLFADTFNRYYERENLDAALKVLVAGGYRVHLPRPAEGRRPLCCGRSFLSVGLVAEARAEAERALAVLAPFAARGVPIVGLEPSCLLSFRDEVPALLRGAAAKAVAAQALLFEEFLAREAKAGRLALPLGALPQSSALLHGHCHQKAFAAMGATESVLRLVPGLDVETVETSCCGMAGAFGYQAETIDASHAMAELSLLPAIRAAPEALIVADGTSCRHQIADGTGRRAAHVAVVLAQSLDAGGCTSIASS